MIIINIIILFLNIFLYFLIFESRTKLILIKKLMLFLIKILK